MAPTLVAPDAPVSPVRRPRLLTIKELEAIPNRAFPEGEKLELIEGLIYTKTPETDPHITAVSAAFAALWEAFGAGFFAVQRSPLKMGTISAPEPDVIVLRGTWRNYDGRRPDPLTDVPLVVEASDSSLADDRAKAQLYARYGVPEYWIVNVGGRTLEVRRLPRDEEYAEMRVYCEGETAEANGAPVAVADLLPKAE